VSPGEDLSQRLAFLGIRETDLRALEALRPLFEVRGDAIVAAFYRHLLAFEPTRALLRDPEVKRRILVKQRQYLLSLAGPQIDEAYIEHRHKIGEAHERIGLEPRWYLGAYAFYFFLLAPMVSEHLRSDPLRAEQTLSALVKVLILDAQIAMDGYIERRQRELEHLNQELASAGRSLAQEVEQQQAEIRATTERAKAAEELASVATLVAGLAHEIGTPMSVIRGHAELLESAVQVDRVRWRLRTIREQIDRISHLIQTLLNIARPKQPVWMPVDLRKVIEGTLTFLTDKCEKRGVEIEARLKDAPAIQGDEERLQQLLLNLFLNALDAMPEGGTLRVALGPADDGRAEIRVADTGTGVTAEELDRIFDAFYTTKAAGKGIGLGLVVARSIISDHRGTVEVRSEPGSGTEFLITFPRIDRAGT
jgi:signal transduction histidine kinase